MSEKCLYILSIIYALIIGLWLDKIRYIVFLASEKEFETLPVVSQGLLKLSGDSLYTQHNTFTEIALIICLLFVGYKKILKEKVLGVFITLSIYFLGVAYLMSFAVLPSLNILAPDLSFSILSKITHYGLICLVLFLITKFFLKKKSMNNEEDINNLK